MALTDAVGVETSPEDVETLLTLAFTLVVELLGAVNYLVTTLNINVELADLLKVVFRLVSNLLVILIGIVPPLVVGLVTELSPVLAGLGNGLLGPLLSGLTGVLRGLGVAA